eukprot:NODE_490_length_2683_cov_37.107031_g421_i0.p1 GENE.NODE_490_length_2683_cov_37.107031_g421_i0~~NODE_490_length_2683_cov_37.107031_g421_i0.p1  ORF type:complete len:712 (-),score=78.45 NODE_490_length_2683_cov_37.107031_g421_i0:452-2587(-)
MNNTADLGDLYKLNKLPLLWHWICSLGVSIFISLLIIFSFAFKNTAPPLGSFELGIYYSMAVIHGVHFISNILTLLVTRDQFRKAPIACVIVISGISCTTYIIMGSQQLPVFEDCMGRNVETGRWAQWFSCIIIHMAIVNGLHFRKERAIISIGCQVSSLIMAFIASLVRSTRVYAIFIAFCCFLYAHIFYTIYTILKWGISTPQLPTNARHKVEPIREFSPILNAPTDISATPSSSADRIERRKPQHYNLILAMYISTAALFSCFALVYLVGLIARWGKNVDLVLFSLCDFLSKHTFAALCSQFHLRSLDPQYVLTQLLGVEKESFVRLMQIMRYIGHEIRGPLNIIVLASEQLEHQIRTPEERDLLGVIDNSASTVTTVLDDILHYQQLKCGEIQPKMEPCNIREILQTVCNKIEREFKTDIGVVFQEHIPRQVMADSRLLLRILDNLLVASAASSSVHNRIIIEVECNIQTNKCTLHITVTNPDSELTLMSIGGATGNEPFSNLRTGDNTYSRGSGLSFSICREMLHLHGGRLWYDTQSGFITTLHTSLLLTVINEMESQERSIVLFPIDKLRVLVVDDVLSCRVLLQKTLQRMGIECLIAADGVEAVDYGTTCHFDLVIMDLVMPRMDGIQATAKLKARGFRGTIVGLTGNAVEEDINAMKNAGAKEVLIKPLLRPELERVLTEVAATISEPDKILYEERRNSVPNF